MFVLLVAAAFLPAPAHGDDPRAAKEEPNPCLRWLGEQDPEKQTVATLRRWIEAPPPNETTLTPAARACVIAKLRERLGDTKEATEAYREAIRLDPSEPEYNWLFGDYLRNVRGPLQPLFREAETQYREAIRKLEGEGGHTPDLTKARVGRSLVALYERDGQSLFGRIDAVEPPFLYFSSQNRYGRLLGDPNEADEIRDLTSAAQFASSRERLNRRLSPDEVRAMIRGGDVVDTFNRLRLRAGNWPVLDVFVQHRDAHQAQVTDFFQPTRHNDVKLTLYGAALEQTFAVDQLFDLLVRGEARFARRQGLVEFHSNAVEDVRSYVGHAVFSRFIGPDKVSLEVTAAADDIDQNVAHPIVRRGRLVAATLRYELFRPLPLFVDPFETRLAARRSEVFAGVVAAEETFGTADVHKRDYFVGLALKDFDPWQTGRTFAVTVQSTLLSARREGKDAAGRPVPPLENRQYQTSVSLVHRLLDDERRRPDTITPVAFLDLLLFGGHDAAVKGPRDFENFRVGLGVSSKLIAEWPTGGTTFLASARYEFRRFHRAHKDEHLALVDVSMGFGSR